MNCRPYSTPPPGRTSWWRKLAAFGAALTLFGSTASAQCNNGSAFGTITANNVLNVPQTISTCSYRSEYSTVNGTIAGNGYTFSISTGGFITVRSGSPGGAVVAFGNSPLSGVVSPGGTLYPHWNVNAACALESVCVTTTVTNTGPALACSGTPTSGSVPALLTGCSNSPRSIAMTGYTLASGITFSWEESDDNGGSDPWGPVVGGSGATTATYTTPGYSGTRYYRGIATCTNSGLSGPPTNSCQVAQTGNCQFTVARNTGTTFTTIFGNGGVNYPGFLFGSTSTDDATTNPVSIAGTTFQYKGQSVFGFVACTNGWMSFNTGTTSTSYSNVLGGTDVSLRAMLAPFWDDLVCTGNPATAAGQNASMQYKIVGTLGSGTAQIILEWAGMEKFGNPGPNLNFQVILNEAGNTITYRYGTMEGFSGSQNTLWDTSIGMNGWSFTVPTGYTDVMALRDENTTNFDYTPATAINAGLNYKVRVPDCNTEYVFTPAAAYPGPGAAPSAPPVNDEPAGAISLSVGALPCTSLCGTYYNSQFATASAGIPACTAVTPGNPDDDVWFSFIPTATNTNIQVRSGANHDAVIQLLDATATTAIACVNLGAVGTIETLNGTGLSVGIPYLVRVYHAGVGVPTGGRNDFSICVFDAPPPPANDDCAGATPLTVGLTCVPLAGSSLTATASSQALCTGTPDDDVWYSFVAPGNGAIVRVQSVGTYNAAVQIYSSTTNDCNNLVSIACLNATSTAGLESVTLSGLTTGNTYRVRVYHATGGAANGSFTICVEAGPVCPALNTPANAATVVNSPFALTWAAGQFAATYDVYFDQNNPPTTLVSDDQVGTSYNATPGPNGIYYWRVVSNNTLGSSTGCAVRSVNVNIPPCQQPGLVSVTPAPTSASVTWTCGTCIGTYIVEYGAPGFVPGTGATAGAGTVVTSGVTSALLSSLTSGTAYQLYVRQECNPGVEYSLNTGPISFNTALSCGNTFQDNNGAAAYSANLQANPYIRTICPTTPGDKVIVQFTEFRTENVYDPLYVFDGSSTSAPKIAHPTNGNSNSSPDPWQPGGWWNSTSPSTGTAALAAAPTNTGIPGIVIATNPSGCLTFAHITDTSVQYEGFTATVSCGTPHYDCATAGTILCGDSKTGFTFGGTNTLPPTACAFNGSASTSGVSWWLYNALATEDVTVSTCGTTTLNTRISLFAPTPDCTNLVCLGASDDAPGCPNGTSSLRFRATMGQQYYIAVHGNAANNGLFQVQLFCEPVCVLDPNDNDNCANALPITTQLNDGLQVLTLDDNSCSYVDGPTTCSGAAPAVGNWYSFTTPGNSSYRVYVVDNSVSGAYTAQFMKFALFDGACTDLLASGPVNCSDPGAGFTNVSLNPLSNYKLFVYNDGSLSQKGSFGVWVDNPALNDAAVTAVNSPLGTVCDQVVQPEIVLENFGEATLTSVDLNVSIDNGPVVASYQWTGSLATGASTVVTLPLLSVPGGNHTLQVTSQSPNNAADQIPGNNTSSTSFDATGQSAVVTVKTGSDGSQCTWAIYDPFFFPVGQGGPYMGQNLQTITTSVCLATTFGNCFYFFVYDNAGDGLVNGANWEMRDSQGRLILTDNGAFVGQSPSIAPASPIYFAHEFCLPLGPSPIQAAECNVFNNYLNNKVYTTTALGAINYQFEFSDPNAGFYRRITVPRNWVKFGEMVSTPLVYGTTYFCRARADVANDGMANDYYGAGCEMALAPVQPVCTELISTPGSTLSCGATKTFGGSDKVWAQPVSYATQYRFSFVGLIDPDGPTGPLTPINTTRNIIRTSYVCPLNWATYTLVSGNTYSVTVECFVGGVWSGYCGATCPLSILNPPAQGGRLGTEAETAQVSLWPNPVRDGRVNVLIADLVDENQRIAVDIYDAYGKRVFTQQYENTGDVFNQVLELDEAIAAGNYMVNITVNNEVYIERLNVVR